MTCWTVGFWLFMSSALIAEPDYDAYAGLLSKYVSGAGVRYAEWANDKADLRRLEETLERFAAADVSALRRDEQKAFYINLYNAAMLQAVFERYPLDSVKDIGLVPFSIFRKKFIRQGDHKLSLDDVEKGILLEDYFDARIHFAVNCASESCPPLRAEPFTGEKLEGQLEEQTRLFAQSERAAQADETEKKIRYSELFRWYDADFEGDHPAEYLNHYRDVPLPLDNKPDWIPYDWALNAVR